MTDSTAEAIVVLVYRVIWFLGQALLMFVLWNWFVADALGVPRLGPISALGVFALARLLISPPELTITRD